MNELGKTADSVAAHLGLGTVGIEHAHTKPRLRADLHQNDSVGANAELPVAEPNRLFPRFGRDVVAKVAQAVDQDEVIADAVHLGEAHVRKPSPAWARHATA